MQRVLCEILDGRLPRIRIVCSGHSGYRVVLELSPQTISHILRRLDVAAEDNRTKRLVPLEHITGEKLDQAVELGIVRTPGERRSLFLDQLQCRRLLFQNDRRRDVARLRLIKVGHSRLVRTVRGLLLRQLVQPILKRLYGRCRRRRCTTQETECRIPVDVVLVRLKGMPRQHATAVVEHMVEELLPGSVQLVGDFRNLPRREVTIRTPFRQIGTTALNEEIHELRTQFGMLSFGKRGEFRLQEREQIGKAQLVSRVRRRRRQHHMPIRILRERLDELPAALFAAPHLRAGMCLVDNHELRGCLTEHGRMRIGLDVVQRNDGERIVLKDCQGLIWDAALKRCRRRSRHRLGHDVEVPVEFRHPLVDERRRTQHASTLDLTTVKELAQNEPRFNRLADTDVIGDQETGHGLLQRHHQRHKLIGTRRKRQVPERTERTRSCTK